MLPHPICCRGFRCSNPNARSSSTILFPLAVPSPLGGSQILICMLPNFVFRVIHSQVTTLPCMGSKPPNTSMGLQVFSDASAKSFNDGKPSLPEARLSMSALTTSQCCPGGIVQPMETRLPPHPSFARMRKAPISGHGRFLPTPRRVCRDKAVMFPTFSTWKVCRIFAACFPVS